MDQKVQKISEIMGQLEKFVTSELKNNPENAILVASALLAVARNLYVSTLGVEDTARMFETVADSFIVTERFMQNFKPTIH